MVSSVPPSFTAKEREVTPYLHPCRPPFWARGGHSQTILAHLWPTGAAPLNERSPGTEVHDIPVGNDGDRLRTFYSKGTSGVLVAIFHGLSGDSNADYVRLTIAAARGLGHSVLAVNHRGCGAGRGLARGLYHSGRADDLGAVLEWARTSLSETKQLAVGFSLSGNALLLLLSGSYGTRPDAGIAINPPIDLEKCSDRLSSQANKIYDKRFVRRCLRAVRERMEDGLIEAGYELPRVQSLRDFDERITAPFAGFQDAEDYYRRCSTFRQLDQINVPTVILSSADDPFVGLGDLQDATLSPSIHLHIEQSGGHVGYLERGRFTIAARHWLGGALTHYLSEIHRSVM
ncbi:MAG: putative alpha/beta-fold hydrolase [Planctomycetota bacterium]|jgi:predicted alpha/beta-fold hydrolase